MEEFIQTSDQYLILEFETYDRYGEQYKPYIPRKMRAQWTPELAQDLEAYHSIDAEAELTALLSEDILKEEIDKLGF